MTKKEQLKLAKHLKGLAEKLKEKGTDWRNFVIGNLEGISEMLELTAGEENKHKII